MLLPPLEIATRERCQLLDVTDQVRAALRAARVEDGVLVAWCPHTTAGLTVNEDADPDVRRDLLATLEDLVPRERAGGRYLHAEGNSDAHAKASLVGTSATLVIHRGDLLLGTWQGLFLCEFDGPRTRTLHLKVLAG
jgi:secondary thiamine-phosphate synthase enzyme